MKATLEFQLPEDESEYKAATIGMTCYLCLIEITNVLRTIRKHHYEEYMKKDDPIGAIQDEIYDILTSRGITLEELP